MTVGIEHGVMLGTSQPYKVRLDVVILLDKIYPLRARSGIGVSAAQFGMRLGALGTLSDAS